MIECESDGVGEGRQDLGKGNHGNGQRFMVVILARNSRTETNVCLRVMERIRVTMTNANPGQASHKKVLCLGKAGSEDFGRIWLYGYTWPAVSQKSTETGMPSTLVSCLQIKTVQR